MFHKQPERNIPPHLPFRHLFRVPWNVLRNSRNNAIAIFLAFLSLFRDVPLFQAVPDDVITTSSKKMAKKLDWKVVDKVEDSGRGYDRVFSGGQMIATVENGFASVGDEVALRGGRVYLAEK